MTTTAITTVATPAGPVAYDALAPGNDHLDDGTPVVCMTGEFGCLEACIATLFAVPLEDVPAPPQRELSQVETLQSFERLHAWTRGRGFRTVYSEIDRHLFDRYWIGVSVDPRPHFNHTVVCRRRTVVHDPALSVPVPDGYEIELVCALHYAISWEPLPTETSEISEPCVSVAA